MEDSVLDLNGKWNPFGNYNDRRPPSHRWRDYPEWLRLFLWYVIRNPLHNFTHYWIGVRGSVIRTTGYLQVNGVYRGWVYHSAFLPSPLPFWEYKGEKVEAYFGWRRSGAFSFPVVRVAGAKK